ncbi:MAG: hypothetical protein JNJ41_09355 [Bacteroidia bacterium]|nr:hypothetical protein [Bacteroidia bacterium]
MIEKRSFFFINLIFLVLFSSCLVKAPRYTTAEKVFDLKLGMSKEEVSTALNVKPYYLKSLVDTQSVLMYKYRVTDRAVLPFLLKENNGKSVKGKYVNLMVSYNIHEKATKIESCNKCDESAIEEKKFDVNKLVTFLTVTLPVVLVFLGIQYAGSTP